MSSKAQRGVELAKLFESYYKSHYGVKFKGNLYADKWGFMDMIEDLGWSSAVEVIEYYFKTKPRGGHTRQHLSYHYHEYANAMTALGTENDVKRSILKRMKEEYES
jgi:hypothetical protein